MEHEEVLEIAEQYWAKLHGEYSNWNPIDGRDALYPEDIDKEDPWQFKNFRVV